MVTLKALARFVKEGCRREEGKSRNGKGDDPKHDASSVGPDLRVRLFSLQIVQEPF